MTRIDLNGHSTWALLPKRKGKTIVLLHGGLSSSASLLRVLKVPLSKRFALAAFDRRGHGRTADTDEPFSLEAMANEAICFLELLKRRVDLVGHSDGANVALLVARRRPDLVRRVVAVGANYHHNGLVPMKDFTPESEGFEEFARKYAKLSPDGIEHASVVLAKFTQLAKSDPTMTEAQLAEITVPVLVLVGDDDVARLDHTVSLFESLHLGQLAVVPGASHAVLKEHTNECVSIIERFLLGPKVPVTRYPLRRATSG